MNKTLLAILLFVLFGIGSFIWFVATWDPGKEAPVSALPTAQEALA